MAETHNAADAAFKALEFLASGPKGARPGKAVRDLVRPYVNPREPRSPIRALATIGAISIYNRGRAQWMCITPRGMRLLANWHDKLPEHKHEPLQKEHAMDLGLDQNSPDTRQAWIIFTAGFILGLISLPLLIVMAVVMLLRRNPELTANRLPFGTAKPDLQAGKDWI